MPPGNGLRPFPSKVARMTESIWPAGVHHGYSWKGLDLVRGLAPLCGRSRDQATGTAGDGCDYCKDGEDPSVLICAYPGIHVLRTSIPYTLVLGILEAEPYGYLIYNLVLILARVTGRWLRAKVWTTKVQASGLACTDLAIPQRRLLLHNGAGKVCPHPLKGEIQALLPGSRRGQSVPHLSLRLRYGTLWN